MPNELYHYGVKGMKWGKRKARQPSERKLRRMDKKWEKRVRTGDTFTKVYNTGAGRINKQVEGFNAKYDASRFTSDKKFYEKYNKDYGKLWDDILQSTVDDLIGSNPSGTKRAIAYTNEIGGWPIIDIVDK